MKKKNYLNFLAITNFAIKPTSWSKLLFNVPWITSIIWEWLEHCKFLFHIVLSPRGHQIVNYINSNLNNIFCLKLRGHSHHCWNNRQALKASQDIRFQCVENRPGGSLLHLDTWRLIKLLVCLTNFLQLESLSSLFCLAAHFSPLASFFRPWALLPACASCPNLLLPLLQTGQ